MSTVAIPSLYDQVVSINRDLAKELARLAPLKGKPRAELLLDSFWFKRLHADVTDRGECENLDRGAANERTPSLEFSQT